MNNQEIETLRSKLSKREVESHQSQLTNERQHQLESQIDIYRIRVRNEPTIDNIIVFYGGLEALYSYLQSLNQRKYDTKNHDPLEIQIDQLKALFDELKDYWEFFKFGKRGGHTLNIIKKRGDNFQIHINARMVELCNNILDKLRRAYQSFNFYFRTGRRNQFTGIEGDLIMSKLQQKTMSEPSEENDDVKV